MKYLLPTLIVLPILELYVLIKVGSSIGALSTILLVFMTAVLGLVLLRIQGFETLMSARNKLENLTMPTEEIITGFFLASGGLLLVIPGFITDIFGFMCLTSLFRKTLVGLFNSSIISSQPNFSKDKKKAKKDWIEGELEKD